MAVCFCSVLGTFNKLAVLQTIGMLKKLSFFCWRCVYYFSKNDAQTTVKKLIFHLFWWIRNNNLKPTGDLFNGLTPG